MAARGDSSVWLRLEGCPIAYGRGSFARYSARPSRTSEVKHLLICPLTDGALRRNAYRTELNSYEAGLAFEKREGTPSLGTDKARRLSPQEREAARACGQ